MKVHVLYDKQGKVLAGVTVLESARVGCGIVAPADHFVRDFKIPAEHAHLDPKALWGRLSVDVQSAEHRLIVGS